MYEIAVGIQEFVVGVPQLELRVLGIEEPRRLVDGSGDLRVSRGESLLDGVEFVAGVLVDGWFVVHYLKCHFALNKPVSTNHSCHSH